jgi:hypothetical protein
MDDPNYFNRALTAHAEPGPTQPSTYSAPPNEPKRPSVSPIVGEIIANLGLRYRPSGAADLTAHAEALRLLAEDVSDVPPPLLDEAAKLWARESRFMPKAAELRDLARKIQADRLAGTDVAGQQLQDHCHMLNAMRWVQAKGIRYVVKRGEDGRRYVDTAAAA